MIRQVVAHVLDPNKLKAAPVRPENIISSLYEDGSLSVLWPSLQVSKPAALSELSDQVYETVLYEEVQHALDPQDPHFVKVHVQVPKDNGVHESLQGFLKVRQVFQCQRWQVYSNQRSLSESVDYLAADHIRPVVMHGLNPPHKRPLPCHQPVAASSSPDAGHKGHQTSHVLADTIMSVSLWLYFCLGHQHHVKPPTFHRTDGLCQPKAPDILDVQCPNGEPGWALGTGAQR